MYEIQNKCTSYDVNYTKYNGSEEEYTIHRNQLSIYMYEFHQFY